MGFSVVIVVVLALGGCAHGGDAGRLAAVEGQVNALRAQIDADRVLLEEAEAALEATRLERVEALAAASTDEARGLVSRSFEARLEPLEIEVDSLRASLMADLQALLELEPGAPAARFFLGQLSTDEAWAAAEPEDAAPPDYSAARRAFEAVVASGSGRATEAHYMLGVLAGEADVGFDDEAALAHFGAVIEAAPARGALAAEAHMRVAELRLARGERDAARRHYEAAIDTDRALYFTDHARFRLLGLDADAGRVVPAIEHGLAILESGSEHFASHLEAELVAILPALLVSARAEPGQTPSLPASGMERFEAVFGGAPDPERLLESWALELEARGYIVDAREAVRALIERGGEAERLGAWLEALEARPVEGAEAAWEPARRPAVSIFLLTLDFEYPRLTSAASGARRRSE